jgi:stage II sporulation protein D
MDLLLKRFPCLLLMVVSSFLFLVTTDAGLAVAKKQTGGSSHKSTKATKTADESAPRVNFRPYPPMVHAIRIGLASKTSVVHFAVWAPGALFVDDRPVFRIDPGLPYVISGGRVVELGTNRSYFLPVDKRSVITAGDYRVWIDNRWYRGSLEIINFGLRVTAINVLDIEEYLLGVVPSEMPSSWHPEALKAQAVAARSYAWAHMYPRGSKWATTEGYDLVPDVRDQAYKGLAAEANSTYWAVQQTRGIILKNSGQVKPGFYRAWVGDAFENLNIRKQAVPSATLEKITAVPKIVGVTVKQWDATGNARDIQVIGQKKTREVYGVALAHMLGLSTAGILDVQASGPNWVFTYRGPGNGARGLSQHGANMLASNGWHYDQILTQYYQDNDGKLRLDYIDNYRAQTAAYPMRAAATNNGGHAHDTESHASESHSTESRTSDSSSSPSEEKPTKTPGDE